MGRQLIGWVCFAALAAALILRVFGEVPAPSAERKSSRATPTRAPESAARLSAPALGPGDAASGRAAAANARQDPGDETPPWLEALLHDPDPNVRIQGLDAWARQPTASLDPVTYALVDPDEAVRARAQEVFERELARR